MVWAWNLVYGRFINSRNGRKFLTLLTFGCPSNQHFPLFGKYWLTTNRITLKKCYWNLQIFVDFVIICEANNIIAGICHPLYISLSFLDQGNLPEAISIFSIVSSVDSVVISFSGPRFPLGIERTILPKQVQAHMMVVKQRRGVYSLYVSFRECHEWYTAPSSTCLRSGPWGYFRSECCTWWINGRTTRERFPCTVPSTPSTRLDKQQVPFTGLRWYPTGNRIQPTRFGRVFSTYCNTYRSKAFILFEKKLFAHRNIIRKSFGFFPSIFRTVISNYNIEYHCFKNKQSLIMLRILQLILERFLCSICKVFDGYFLVL